MEKAATCPPPTSGGGERKRFHRPQGRGRRRHLLHGLRDGTPCHRGKGAAPSWKRQREPLCRGVPHAALGLHGDRPHPGALRPGRFRGLPRQGRLQRALAGNAADLHQRLHLSRQDPLPRGKPGARRLFQPGAGVCRSCVQAPDPEGDFSPGGASPGIREPRGPRKRPHRLGHRLQRDEGGLLVARRAHVQGAPAESLSRQPLRVRFRRRPRGHPAAHLGAAPGVPPDSTIPPRTPISSSTAASRRRITWPSWRTFCADSARCKSIRPSACNPGGQSRAPCATATPWARARALPARRPSTWPG